MARDLQAEARIELVEMVVGRCMLNAGAVGRGAGEASWPSLGITCKDLVKTVLMSGVVKVALAA